MNNNLALTLISMQKAVSHDTYLPNWSHIYSIQWAIKKLVRLNISVLYSRGKCHASIFIITVTTPSRILSGLMGGYWKVYWLQMAANLPPCLERWWSADAVVTGGASARRDLLRIKFWDVKIVLEVQNCCNLVVKSTAWDAHILSDFI